MTQSTTQEQKVAPVFNSDHRRNTPRILTSLWNRRWLATGAVVAAGTVTGALSGVLMPRGPVSAMPGVAEMATGLVLGAFAGLLLRKRRAVVLVLLVHVVTLELVRLPYDGPTVDGIHLGSLYGVIAVAMGRGFQGLLLMLPALVGVIYGAGLARWFSRESVRCRWTSVLRKILAGGLAVGMIAAVYVVAQPARTAPIRGADGNVVAGSIAELRTAHVGGHDTAVMLRGESAKAPVLLYLAGGPGGTDLGAMRLFGEELEQNFLVVTWDQRGAGASYGALDPTSTLTLDQVVDDTIEFVDQLRTRFHKDKIYVVGNSWGTLLGVLAVQKRPDLFAAYVGAGQMANLSETDRMFYDDTLAWARQTGNDSLVQELTSNGPPPYGEVFPYEQAISHEHEWNEYAMEPDYANKGELPMNLFVPEYDLVQKVAGFASFLDTFTALYPRLQDIDFATQANRLQVPVYLLEGEHEARGRVIPAREWFDALDAPTKQWIEVPKAGHRPHFEQPAAFATTMRTVLAETS